MSIKPPFLISSTNRLHHGLPARSFQRSGSAIIPTRVVNAGKQTMTRHALNKNQAETFAKFVLTQHPKP